MVHARSFANGPYKKHARSFAAKWLSYMLDCMQVAPKVPARSFASGSLMQARSSASGS